MKDLTHGLDGQSWNIGALAVWRNGRDPRGDIEKEIVEPHHHHADLTTWGLRTDSALSRTMRTILEDRD